MNHKTRAKDTVCRKAIRFFTNLVISQKGDPHTPIWIEEAAGFLFVNGIVANMQEGYYWTKLILDHMVLEGEYRYASESKDTYSKLTLVEEARVYAAMAVNALSNPGVKEYIALVNERNIPSTDK